MQVNGTGLDSSTMLFTLSTPAMVGDRLLFGEGRRSTLAQVTVAGDLSW
jgi:hypothetical protein